MYNNFIERSNNPFTIHWRLFKAGKIVLEQLLLLSFSWIIKHEDSYLEKPMPTEPTQYHNTKEVDFKEVMKAWMLGCNSREMENKSNAWWLDMTKKYFLKTENSYEEGIKLFNKHKEEEII